MRLQRQQELSFKKFAPVNGKYDDEANAVRVIDGRQLTELELLTFSIDDYVSISDALGASMKKITGL